MKLSLDPKAINDVLDGHWAEARRLGRTLAEASSTHDDPADDLDTARAKTLDGVMMMAETGLPMTGLSPEMGGKNEHATNVAGFEETVTASPSLNVRSGPGTGYSLVGSLATGAQVAVLAEQNGWYQVLFPSGSAAVTGWVSASYVTLS